MKHLWKQKDGFTLVELIVVLVILGILLGIAVPSFTGYITKQQESDAITELREVVACAQSVSNDAFSKNQPPASGYLEMTSEQKSDILKLSGTSGEIKKVVVDPDSYRITGLKYQAENGVMVRYDVNDDPKYAVSDESVYTELEKFINLYQEITQRLLEEEKITLYKDGRETVTAKFLEEAKLLLPEVDASFLENYTKKKPLYWQPYFINGDHGLHNSSMTLLFSTPNDGTPKSNLNDSWHAYLVYFDGQVYVSTSSNGYSGIGGLKDAYTKQDVLDYLDKNSFIPLP